MQNNVFVLLCIPKNRRTFADEYKIRQRAQAAPQQFESIRLRSACTDLAPKIKNFSLYINLKGKDYDKDCKTADRAYR